MYIVVSSTPLITVPCGAVGLLRINNFIRIVAASERNERAAKLIVTGFLWSMWPSRLGHD